MLFRSEALTEKPQIIAANKIDLLENYEVYKDFEKIMKDKGYDVFPISAATNKGLHELMREVAKRLESIEVKPLIDESEEFKYYKADENVNKIITVRKENDYFIVEGKPIEKLFNSTNFDDMDSLRYFQNFLRKRGIVDELKKLGIQDGETVKILDFEFEYYD